MKNVPPGGDSLIVECGLPGTVYDDAGAKWRPCADGKEFLSTNQAPSIELPDVPSQFAKTENGIEYVLFWTVCLLIPGPDVDPDAPAVLDPRTAWIGRPRAGAMIPDLWAQLQLIVSPPIVFWPTMDPEFGWLYVNTNMEFRVAALAPKTATGTLTNILGTATATITATPATVTFYSGEPSRGTTTCTVADAAAPFHIDIIGACAYKYKAASSVAANGRTFNTRMVVNWEVTGDLQPDTPRTLETYTEAPIAVAEVQALVCANPGC